MRKMKSEYASKENIYDGVSILANQMYELQRGNEMGLGDTIRHYRQSKGIKAVHVARKADIDPRTLAAIESGRIQNPSIEKLDSVAKALGITLGDLFLQTRASQPENFYLGEQKGSYTLEFQQDGFKAVSYVPMNPDFFIGKVTLAGKSRLESSKLSFEGRIFIQMILGKLKLTIQKEEILVKEGCHLLINGRLPHSFQNPLIKESSFLFVSVPSFVTLTSRR